MSADHNANSNRVKIPAPPEFSAKAHIQSLEQYQALYDRSINDPEGFWLEQAEILDWVKKPTVARNYTWDTANADIQHRWFEDGVLNVAYNCLDRHLGTPRENKVAILWQGEPEDDVQKWTYRELYEEVCKFANVLKSKGVGKGDRVAIYMPMIPELPIAMLACARIGAIHSVVFGGFSATALSSRIQDSDCKMLITSNVSLRAGRRLRLKDTCDEAVAECPTVESVIVFKRTDDAVKMQAGRDVWWHDEMAAASADCPIEPMASCDSLFVLYTSGSTGTPKGILHGTGGYLTYVALTHKHIFDIQEDDIYWCTADCGWITGHSYIVYGPLANGATSLMFEGVPTYPDASRFWQVVDKFKVSIFYTAPTAIRSLMGLGLDYVKRCDLSSLRLLGSVGEPINPAAWLWYYDNIGQGRCPIVDTWWQTETGGILITPLPGAMTLKPASASKPFYGVEPIILRENGAPCDVGENGSLCIVKPWPGMAMTMWNAHERFIDTYFTLFPNLYVTGDGCILDEDGDYWLQGRIDDVLNVSGHRIGTAEVEHALVSHPKVAEAAVVGRPHDIKGTAIYAYVTLQGGVEKSDEMLRELVMHVRREIGPIATPDTIQFADALPKTRSGKIMRRILRKIAEGEFDSLGDISTLADPGTVETLIRERK
jgi:acetyl-CoA synthetase